ncbi:MAG TPA: signal peptide peptidase SppA [Steroidobacteraceae bacterium]|nr:signal peptide peptidase SppA [Steroidobacteraceae bacterium]
MGVVGRLLHGVWRFLDGLRRVLHLVLLLFLLAIVWAAARHPLPLVPAKAALVVRPEGRLVEQLTGSPFDRSIGLLSGDHEPETLVRDLVEAIRAAGKDERIQVLVLDPAQLGGGGLTKLRAIADAVQDFRRTGKRVLSYARYASQEQYYLMAQADEAYLEPTGAIGVIGYAAYGLYFHDALERLGVEVNVFRVGTHKSFTEPFTRQDMSPEDREQTREWLMPLWQAYANGVETARKLPAGTLDAFIAEAVPSLKAADGDEARLAEERHLITGRKTALEFERLLVALVGEDHTSHSFNAIEASDYLTAIRPEAALKRHPAGEVAVLVAAGNIVDGERPAGEIGGDSFAEIVRGARYDEDVKAVVLRIDSGGGSMMASEVIRQEVAALKAAGKPVVASFSSVAASGGYYIAMDADRIVATPTTITGSIGVFGLVPTFEKTIGKLGVASDGVATSKLAGSMHLERALAPEAKDVLQLGVEHAYRDFVARVAAARHKTPAQIEAVAEGRVYIAPRATELGLVDELGDLDSAVKAAAELAKLAPGKYEVTFREKELSWRERLLRELRAEGQSALARLGLAPQAPQAPRALRPVLGTFERQLQALGALNDPRQLYSYCGCVAD